LTGSGRDGTVVSLTTFSSLARVFRHRPPFTLALVGLVVLLTGLTGAIIGGVAWRAISERGRAPSSTR
jgi:hypothetical protein